ncbi:MAG: GntR family transcriptional regulator [Gammaproteobacteria bacterium]|jgi:GntR family transcriptional regulator|nr:GntR family transcriptional regulator [Gammaproteobacteria bacterium]
MFSINPQSGLPIYKQLMEQIRRMISSGQLKPGDNLPSVRELALTHAVNAMTISKAYNMLEAEGLLARQRGKAMTVSDNNQLSENKQDRLKRLQPALSQLTIATDQLELDIEDVITLLRNKVEK